MLRDHVDIWNVWHFLDSEVHRDCVDIWRASGLCGWDYRDCKDIWGYEGHLQMSGDHL